MITYVYSDNHMCKYILCTYIYIIYTYMNVNTYLFIYLYIIYTCIKPFTVDGYDMDINNHVEIAHLPSQHRQDPSFEAVVKLMEAFKLRRSWAKVFHVVLCFEFRECNK